MDDYASAFASMDSLVYGISPVQKSPRGLAVASAILTYLGKPIAQKKIKTDGCCGFQDIYCQAYPGIASRLMGNGEVAEFDLFTEKHALKTIRFSFGMESGSLHVSMYLVACLMRLGLPMPLMKYGQALLKFTNFYGRFGTDKGGMHMLIEGRDDSGQQKFVKWFIIAKKGDGPRIPIIPLSCCVIASVVLIDIYLA
jgi:hypothetical protein